MIAVYRLPIRRVTRRSSPFLTSRPLSLQCSMKLLQLWSPPPPIPSSNSSTGLILEPWLSLLAEARKRMWRTEFLFSHQRYLHVFSFRMRWKDARRKMASEIRCRFFNFGGHDLPLRFLQKITSGNCGPSASYKHGGSDSMGKMVTTWICLNFAFVASNEPETLQIEYFK